MSRHLLCCGADTYGSEEASRHGKTRKIRWKSRWGRVNGSFCDQHGKKKWDRKGGRQEAKAKEKNHGLKAGKGEKQ